MNETHVADEQLTDEQLNLFIDEQLDTDEMHQIHNVLSKNSALRDRICQLRAVREFISIAYQNPPVPENPHQPRDDRSTRIWRSLAASLVLALGVLLGWGTHELNPLKADGDAAADAFKFYAEQAAVDHHERKIILHVSTDDIGAVKAALDEADTLIASYRKAHAALKIDIITNKNGINLLRTDVSPYVDRIETMVHENDNVSLYACERSILKAEQREGRKMVFLPETVTTRSARDLIPERLKQGWVYIKV
jgi:uncharacterized protein